MRIELYCVIGVTCSGKTTIMKALEEQGITKSIFIGQMCRKLVGAKAIADDKNPTCPENLEKAVREFVITSCQQYVDESTKNGDPVLRIMIDGMPRHISQVDFINDLARYWSHMHEVRLITFMIHCSRDTVLRLRIKGRQNDSKESLELAEKRYVSDFRQIHDVIAALIQKRICIFEIDSDDDLVSTIQKVTDIIFMPRDC